MIGNSSLDILAAKNAQTVSVLVNYGYDCVGGLEQGPDFVIDHLEQILQFN